MRSDLVFIGSVSAFASCTQSRPIVPDVHGHSVESTHDSGTPPLADSGGEDSGTTITINTSLQPNCLAVLAAGLSTGDGLYSIDPDGAGGAASFEVPCEMSADGGGWTRLVEPYRSTLVEGEAREYLYTYNGAPGAWYRSPQTTAMWSWSTYTAVEGTWAYSDGSASPTGSFDCSSVENGFWGVGCSNGPSTQYKCIAWGGSSKPATGTTRVCQDLPDVFRVGACADVAQIWVRP